MNAQGDFGGIREKADQAHRERRWDAAAELYRVYLDLVPEDAGARAARAITLLNSGQPGEALSEARQVYDRAPGSDWPALALLETLDANGLEEELTDRAEEISKRRPWLAPAWYHRGIAALQAGRYEQAVEHLRKAIGRRGHYFMAWLALGDAFMKQKEHARALYHYGRALRFSADSPNPDRARFAALMGRGHAYVHLGRYDKALEIAQGLEGTDIDAAEAQSLKARSMFGLRHPGAVAVAENAVRLGSHDAHLKLRLAREYAFAGRDEEARALADGTHVEPEEYATRHEKAAIYAHLGDVVAAEAELRAMEDGLEPHVLFNTLAAACLSAGEPRRAARWSLKALGEKRDEAVLNNAGIAFVQLGKTLWAKRLFRAALDVRPGMPEALYELGRCHAIQGEKSQARERFRELIGSPIAREAQRAAAVDLLARLDRDQEVEAYHKSLGLVTVSYGEREQERQLLGHFKSRRFEDECCRLARHKPLRWFSAEPRRVLKHAGRQKEIDAYGLRREGDREAVCLGECKLRLEEPRPVDHSEVNELVRKIALAKDIEGESGREVEGYFFANAGYDEEARELAEANGIRLFEARLGKDWRRRADWKVNDLRESRW